MFVPNTLLKQLYTFGSLRNTEQGVEFSIKNRLSGVQVTAIRGARIDRRELPPEALEIHLGERVLRADEVTEQAPIPFPLKETLRIVARHEALPLGKHDIELSFETKPFGALKLSVQDSIAAPEPGARRIPRDAEDDYAEAAVRARQRFAEEFTGAELHHVRQHSFDAQLTRGNCEHFVGVAQVPLGLAGPLRVEGEHAQGEFLIPLATTEGTLVASYNRGIQVLNLSGGVKCSVVGDAMQRAPVFVFDDARQGRDFAAWVKAHEREIAAEAEATSSVARLQYIDPYLANKFVYLRFNYSTGDAAGQNMVGRATFAACSWILERYAGVRHFYLESNLATDKKASQLNTLRTRGKRVTAEATIPREVLMQRMRVEPEALVYHSHVANVGSFLSGANNNGAHAANAITALFIATGQDVANVAESSAAVAYAELTPERDLYMSITLPSLIVATHGGGTGLPTQRECLAMLGCTGRGTVNKLAEIVAGVVLAGELSLAAAISSSDWVSSHEQYGRNR